MGLLSTIGSASGRAFGFTRSAVAAAVDAYFNLTTLLLNTSSTNGAQNNTFLDSSTNNFTITRNGNTTQGTFTPFSQTGWSNYFDGTSNSYLTAPDNTAYDIGSGDFVLEGWVYLTASTDYGVVAGQWGIPRGYAIRQRAGKFQFVWVTSAAPSTEVLLDGTTSYALNTWYHVAVIRTGSTIGIFINGTREATNTSSPAINNSTDVFSIGRAGNAADYSTGYISNVRLVKGTNPSGYSASSSTLTVPTTALTAVTGTSILTCQSNRFIDNSTTAATITSASGVSVQAFSPFLPTAAYDTAVVGGSGYFDGSGDYLQVGAATGLNLGTGDFTIECWYYLTSTSNTDATIIADGQASYTSSSVILKAYHSGLGSWPSFGIGSGQITVTANNSNALLNRWNHVAVARTGNTFRVFLNGAGGTSQTSTASVNLNGNSITRIGYDGAYDGIASYFTGNIAGLRVIKGSGGYDATQTTITVPTAPPTAVTNTQLLLNYTNASIYDSASKNVLETVGNAQVSTTQAKWGTTSMAFDGTGDWLFLNSSAPSPIALGGGDFTVEMWLYPNSSYTSAFAGLMDSRSTADGAGLVYFGYTGTANQIGWKDNTTFVVTGTVTQSAWNHVAVVRDSGTLKLYINGSLASSGANSTNYTAAFKYIGTSFDPLAFNGYMDDLRITRGYARYSGSTYTQPTAAFSLQ